MAPTVHSRVVLAILGTDAPFAVDLFLIVQVATLPLMGVAIACAARGKIRAHATLMVTAFAAFLLSLIAFEWTVRTMEDKPSIPTTVLAIHLCFALPGLVLWGFQLVRARRAFSDPARHRRMGRQVFALLIATVATGIWVYAAMFS
jgi:uncharacterized membrane protein YozB (DUF420 family)